MEKTTKYYKNRFGYGKTVKVIIEWSADFLQLIKNRFGLNCEGFTSSQVEDIFRHECSKTATKLKLWRLFKQGWFSRRKEKLDYDTIGRKNIFLYSFTPSAKQYYHYWGGFNNGPLVEANSPKIVEKIVEKKTIVSDKFLGEI